MNKNFSDIRLDRCEAGNGQSMTSMHAHSSHELYFLISGQRRYCVGHTIYDVAPGNLVFIPRTQLHRTTMLGDKGYDRYALYFDETKRLAFPQLVGREAFDGLMESGCLQLPPEAVRQVTRDLEQLEQELSAPSAWSTAAAYLLLEDILLCAMRHGRRKQHCHGEIADKVQEVTHYICENYASELTLSEAAGIACMEETYFSKRFKALTGFGFHEYLTQTRLRAAERLLRETSISVTEIAALCGFSGGNYFGDVFRRWHGLSPTQYRSRCKKENSEV